MLDSPFRNNYVRDCGLPCDVTCRLASERSEHSRTEQTLLSPGTSMTATFSSSGTLCSPLACMHGAACALGINKVHARLRGNQKTFDFHDHIRFIVWWPFDSAYLRQICSSAVLLAAGLVPDYEVYCPNFRTDPSSLLHMAIGCFARYLRHLRQRSHLARICNLKLRGVSCNGSLSLE